MRFLEDLFKSRSKEIKGMKKILIPILILTVVVSCKFSRPAITTAAADATTTKIEKSTYYLSSFSDLETTSCDWKYDIPMALSDDEKNPVRLTILSSYVRKTRNQQIVFIFKVRPYISNGDDIFHFVKKVKTSAPFAPLNSITVSDYRDFFEKYESLSFHVLIYGLNDQTNLKIYARGFPKPVKINGRKRWVGKFSDLKFIVKRELKTLINRNHMQKWVVDPLNKKPAYYALSLSPTQIQKQDMEIHLKGKEYTTPIQSDNTQNSSGAAPTSSQNQNAVLTVYVKDELSRPVKGVRVFVSNMKGFKRELVGTDSSGLVSRTIRKNRELWLKVQNDKRYGNFTSKRISHIGDQVVRLILPRPELPFYIDVKDENTGGNVENVQVKLLKGELSFHLKERHYSSHFGRIPIYPDERFDIVVKVPGIKDQYVKNLSLECDSVSESELEGCKGIDPMDPIVIKLKLKRTRYSLEVRPQFRMESEIKGTRDVLKFDPSVMIFAQCAKSPSSNTWEKLGFDKSKLFFSCGLTCVYGSRVKLKISSEKFMASKIKIELKEKITPLKPMLRFKKPLLYILIHPSSRFTLGAEKGDLPKRFRYLNNRLIDLAADLDSVEPWKHQWSMSYLMKMRSNEYSPEVLAKRYRFSPGWDDDERRKNLISKLYYDNPSLPYAPIIDGAIDFMNSFSLPKGRTKGVVLVIMPNPSSPSTMHDMKELENKLRRERIVTLIVQFSPTDRSRKDLTDYDSNFKNMKIIDFGIKKEENKWFYESLDGVVKTELKKLLERNGLSIKD